MRRGTSGLDPIPRFLCSLSTLLGTTELMTHFEEWGHVFIVFYLPAHNIWCRILPTEDICKNPRSPLLIMLPAEYRLTHSAFLLTALPTTL